MLEPPERHDALLSIERPVVMVTHSYPPRHAIRPHVHWRSQLLVLENGPARVTTPQGSWVAGASIALWIPAETPHSVQLGQHAAVMRSVYFDVSVEQLGTVCCPVRLTELLRALVIEFGTVPPLYELEGRDARLVALLIDYIRPCSVSPLVIPTASDPRLRKLMDGIVADPADNRPLKQWGNLVGASEKTLSRAFVRETQMGFRQWRQRVRALKAMELLAAGGPVAAVAAAVGYESVSAFNMAFRETCGVTPGALYAAADPPR